MSKAYRIYDIEADRVMISRDVTFNESKFAFSPTLPQETVDDTALDFDSMSISDELHPMQFKQTGNARIVQTIKSKRFNGLVMEPDWKKQVRQKTLSRAKQNGDQAPEPTLTKSGKAAMSMMMTPHLKPFGERVPTQLKVLQTCPSRQRLRFYWRTRSSALA